MKNDSQLINHKEDNIGFGLHSKAKEKETKKRIKNIFTIYASPFSFT